MGPYEDLMRRAVEARGRAGGLYRDSRRIQHLAQILREAYAGDMSIRRCAWCGCYEFGGEWLPLEAVGAGQLRIAASLLDMATHGICPLCLDRQLDRSQAGAGDDSAMPPDTAGPGSQGRFRGNSG